MKEDGKKVQRMRRMGWVLCLLAVLVSSIWYRKFNQKKEPIDNLISVASLEKIIDIDELSTYQAVYNGIAEVKNLQDANMIDYYVSYEAKVNAGISFEKIDIAIDDTKKIICVKLPEIEITDVSVDIGSLDYIFCNKEANTSTVSQQAYRACVEDARAESQSEKDIYLLAKQNAENMIKALVQPFVEQFDHAYTLKIS